MLVGDACRSGQEWCQLFSQYNSGTYNNEFMIVSMHLFTPGQPLVPGTLWLLDQVRVTRLLL